ncbi:MAG: hypothetical protein OHK0013_21000 [Sandaracinaceae bacterium]
MVDLGDSTRARPVSSPIGAIGALIGVLAVGTLARTRSPQPVAVPAAAPPVHAPGPLDLNLASAAELERLPRIGPALAARIVADREENGPFLRVEELDRVQGIGPATLAALAGLVKVEGARVEDRPALQPRATAR